MGPLPLSLIAGYGSDSEDEDQTESTPEATGSTSSSKLNKSNPTASTSTTSPSSLFSTLLPPPKHNQNELDSISSSSSAGISSKLGLPPASSSSRPGLPLPAPTQSSTSTTSFKKRKDKGRLQIGVDSLSTLEKSTSDDEEEDYPKPSKPISSSGKPSHALFGMLPAPKRPEERAKDGFDPSEERLANAGAIKIVEQKPMETQDGDGPPPAKKVKGNNDFRAMLGLKPHGKEKEKKEVKPVAVEKKVDSVTTKASNGKAREVPPIPVVQEESASTDFFSLGPSTSTSKSNLNSTPSFNISSAPIFEQESLPPVATDASDPINPYRGWTQDPDGSWVPITPEAWTAYNNFMTSQSQEISKSSSKRKETTQSESELSKYGLQESDLESIDAGEIAARAFALRGVVDLTTPSANGTGTGASVTAGMNHTDKMKFSKGRAKGQLSSLIAHANEKRGEMEQKWAEGKDKQRQGGAKYGF